MDEQEKPVPTPPAAPATENVPTEQPATEPAPAPPTPQPVEELIKAYKNDQKLTDEQWEEIKDFLATIPNVKEFLMKEYGYTDRDYGNISNIFSRRKWTLGTKEEIKKPPKKPREPKKEVTPETMVVQTVMQKQKEAAVKIATQHMEDQARLGNLVLSYGSKAAEIGFYKEAEDKVDLMGFAKKALDFYIENRDAVQEMETMIVAYGGLASMYYEASRNLASMLQTLNAQIIGLERKYPQLHYDLIPLRALIRLYKFAG